MALADLGRNVRRYMKLQKLSIPQRKCKDEKEEKSKLIISLEEKLKQLDIEKSKISEQIKRIKAL